MYSKRYKHNEYHGYFLSYYIKDNQVYVLLGKKNFFNRYIHNNPGQYVIPGGKCNFNKLDEIYREFKEETGHEADCKNEVDVEIKEIKFRDKVYCKFYHVSHEEYDKYKKIDMENRDWNERELSSIKWFKLSDALKLMESGQKCQDKDIWQASLQFLTRRRFFSWYNYNRKTFCSREEINKLLKFRENERVLYEKYFNEFKNDILAKGHTDWYCYILNKLKSKLIPPGFEECQGKLKF